MTGIDAALEAARTALERELDAVLPQPGDAPEGRLFAAMRHATLGGGKRLRGFLAMESGRLCGADAAAARRVGAAIELVHAYSLVHDDLPCMDDDDMRRGRPTVHVAFDEATAVLASDALLTLAFDVLADPAVSPDARIRLQLVRALAVAAGGHGMCGGQMLDLMAEHGELDEPAVVRLQRLKTGALIGFAAESGAMLAATTEERRHALRSYAHDLGLAFQIVDDLLDEEGDEAGVGKRVGKDAGQGKATFVSLLGEDGAEARARLLADQAGRHLAPFGSGASALRGLADFVIVRSS